MVRLKGFEPLTHCLEGSCSIHLSYKRISINSLPLDQRGAIGAGDGNRTHVTSLEGWNSTIELHLHFYGDVYLTIYAAFSQEFLKSFLMNL